MKPRKIYLKNFEPTTEKEADLIIHPDNNLPPIFYRRKTPHWLINKPLKNEEWNQHIKINTLVSQDDYNKMVCWWFDNMSYEYTDELIQLVGDAVEKGFDVSMSTHKAKNKLLTFPQEKRKSHIDKFLKQWILSGVSMFTFKLTGGDK